MVDDDLIPLSIAARRLRVTKRWLTAQAEAGAIPHIRAERRILVSWEAVQEALLTRAREQPPAPAATEPAGGEEPQS